MKELTLKKKKDGRMTVMPMMIKCIARDVRVQPQDLCADFTVTRKAEREMESLKKKVSPELMGMLTLQLMAFRGDMQLEMAQDMVIFAYDHVAHTTGCPGADMVLDFCYSWIAHEQGILMECYQKMLNHGRL